LQPASHTFFNGLDTGLDLFFYSSISVKPNEKCMTSGCNATVTIHYCEPGFIRHLY